jgi:site-specific recombinase XerD
MKALLEDYQTSLKLQNKEESTIKMYVHEVKQFLLWLESQNINIYELKQVDLVMFRDSLLNKGMKVATVNKSLSTLNSFFKWARNNNHTTLSFPDHLRLPEDKGTIKPRWLSHQEEEQLLQVASLEKSPFKRARNEALIYVMLDAGLRVEETSQLQVESLAGGQFSILHDNQFSREVPVNPVVKEKIETWISQRNQTEKYKESPFLFVTQRSGRMQSRAIQFVIEGYSEKLGFSVNCQILRNTYCRRLVEAGKTVQQVKQYAGHKSIVTSSKYFW